MSFSPSPPPASPAKHRRRRDAVIPLSPRDITRSGLCIGCGGCVGQASASGPTASNVNAPDLNARATKPVNISADTNRDANAARMELDAYGLYQAAGSKAWQHRRTAEFARICPFSPTARNEDELAHSLFPDARYADGSVGRFESAYVGYVAAGEFRAQGSSGGMVSWMLAELMRAGLIDGAAHVAPVEDPQTDGRFFRYRISRTETEIRAGAKSRYYPVELSNVIQTIKETPGRYAVVGVPCFIKAVQLLRREDPILRERIAFTLGLFCGHMKSARFAESFAWQMGVNAQDIQRVEYRLKDPARPASAYTAQLTLRDGRVEKKDWWNLADGDWGAGFFQDNACNYCDDVVAETADISFGDAWVEPYTSDGNGTNVVVTRSRVLADMVADAIAQGRLSLQPVDAAFVEQTQAAGFRQRREGLAYRLSWPRLGVRPCKRVAPDRISPTTRRKLIYRMRWLISALSHRVFWLARRTRRPALYLRWARWALTLYHGLAYSRGKLGAFVDKWGLRE